MFAVLPHLAVLLSRERERGAKILGMKNRTDNLDPTTEKYESTIAKQDAQIAKLNWYHEQFRLSQQKHFGASSEKTHPDQVEMDLFKPRCCHRSISEEPDVETVTYSRNKTAGEERSYNNFLWTP
jgi:hypothetical protein